MTHETSVDEMDRAEREAHIDNLLTEALDLLVSLQTAIRDDRMTLREDDDA